jgi:hypothetical protein
MNPHGWEFFSWQNLTAAWALVGWTVAIAYVCRRTPLEVLAPRLDAQLVRLGRRSVAGAGAAGGVEKNLSIAEGS